MIDLDTGQLRAFVTVAEHRNFGPAAGELFLSQQALSKRIARLEEVLGVRLFDRTAQGAELTEAGRRFLEPARRSLASIDGAVALARDEDRPLRADVWGYSLFPMRAVRQIVEADTDLRVEISMRAGLPAALTALARREIEVAFGHPTGLTAPLEDAYATRPIRLDPCAAVLSHDHPLAHESVLTLHELRPTTLWFPDSAEQVGFLGRLAEDHGLEHVFEGVNLGLDYILDHVRARTGRFTILSGGAPVPEGSGVRKIPLVEPVPLYSWWMVWRAQEIRPSLTRLHGHFDRLIRQHGWLHYDPREHWLPAEDLAALREA